MTTASPQRLRELAVKAVIQLREAGFTAYWAGGCVRDMCLSITPKDYDIATSATPDQVLEMFPGSVGVGKAFGVIKAKVEDEYFEIATFRNDNKYLDGRRPEGVVFSDPETDAHRRDFTVNAMFYDPLTDSIVDYVGGRADLDARIIRFVGDADSRINEDHLRILRAVRFVTTLGFTLDPDADGAIRTNAALLKKVSGERIREELTKTFMNARRPGDALLMLEDMGLLAVVLPEVCTMRGQEQPPQFHPEGDVMTHTALMLNTMEQRTPNLIWAALLHDVGKPPTATHDGTRIRFNNHAEVGADIAVTILQRLRFSTDDSDAITQAIRNHMRLMEVPNMRKSTLRKLVGAPTFELELELHRLDCLSSHSDLNNHRLLVEFRETMANEPVLPPPLIGGRDVMGLGVREGPEIGRLLKLAYDAQLEGKLTTREESLQWLSSQLRPTSDRQQ